MQAFFSCLKQEVNLFLHVNTLLVSENKLILPATLKSQAIAISRPPPKAQPSIAAIVGIGSSEIAVRPTKYGQ